MSVPPRARRLENDKEVVMNQSTKSLALIAGIALIVIGVIVYLTGHHRVGEVVAVVGILASGASFALPQSRTS
jgi:hypothetical protein